MATERSETQRGARMIVLGLGALALLYVIAAPLAPYVAIVACGLLLAVAVATPAGWLSRRTRMPYRVSAALVMMTSLGLIAAFFTWSGPLVVTQVEDLDGAVREGIARAQEWLASSSFGRAVAVRIDGASEDLSSSSSEMLGSVRRGLARGVEAVAHFVIVILIGVFVAMAPSRYFDGLLRLAPKERRARLREVGQAAVGTLRRWLVARLFLMVALGAAFGIGLALLGVPLALPLGVLAGMLAFIPFLGPALSLLPALAVAFVDGPGLALQVLVLYAGLQLVESNVLEPLVEARAVKIPPALVLLAQVVAVVWFGAIGVLIATPLLVVAVVTVRMLYVEDRLDDHETEEDEAVQRTARARRATAL